MAGRGRRLGGYGEKDGPLRRPGEAAVSPTTTGNINITVLTRKINEINILNIDPILLHEIEILMKQLFVTDEAVKDILSSLHSQALNDSDFGEKLVIALEQVFTFEVDKVCIRSEWLTFVQNDYQMKESLSQSNSRKFANAVMLLGGMYNAIKIRGKPITILGCGLIDYMDLLVNSEEEILLKVLTTQIILNGNQIMQLGDASKRFDSLKQSMRKTLTTKNLSNKGKCWVLLAIDYISNNLKPLDGVIREFYVETLGSNYLNLEEKSKGAAEIEESATLPKARASSASKFDAESVKPNKSEAFFQDIKNLNISNPEPRGMRSPIKTNKSDREVVLPRVNKYEESKLKQRKQGSEIKISSGRSKSPKSDDDFYGIQIEKKKVSDKKGEN